MPNVTSGSRISTAAATISPRRTHFQLICSRQLGVPPGGGSDGPSPLPRPRRRGGGGGGVPSRAAFTASMGSRVGGAPSRTTGMHGRHPVVGRAPRTRAARTVGRTGPAGRQPAGRRRGERPTAAGRSGYRAWAHRRAQPPAPCGHRWLTGRGALRYSLAVRARLRAVRVPRDFFGGGIAPSTYDFTR